MFTHYNNIVQLVLYILTGYQVLGIVYLNQLSGAGHTHNILSRYYALFSVQFSALFSVWPRSWKLCVIQCYLFFQKSILNNQKAKYKKHPKTRYPKTGYPNTKSIKGPDLSLSRFKMTCLMTKQPVQIPVWYSDAIQIQDTVVQFSRHC